MVGEVVLVVECKWAYSRGLGCMVLVIEGRFAVWWLGIEGWMIGDV
jgi:hypothetical protein